MVLAGQVVVDLLSISVIDAAKVIEKAEWDISQLRDKLDYAEVCNQRLREEIDSLRYVLGIWRRSEGGQ
jgi:CRISPR/Cas system-associated protein Cas5 (RAMP superfamily)